MLNELNKEDKVKIIKHKLLFWEDKLKENEESIEFLNNHGDQIKINMNIQDALNIKAKINALKQELDKILV